MEVSKASNIDVTLDCVVVTLTLYLRHALCAFDAHIQAARRTPKTPDESCIRDTIGSADRVSV